MKTSNHLLLLAFLAIIALQACKTRQKIVVEEKDPINKTTINKDTVLSIKYFLDDTTLYCFNNANILAIKGKIPADKLKCFDFENNWDCKDKGEIASLIWSCLGIAYVDEYLALFEANCIKRAKYAVNKEITDSILKAVDSNQLLGDPVFPYTLASIPNIPPKVKSIFQNYPLFYIVSGHYKIKTIGSIHNGEIVDAASCINFAFNSCKQKNLLTKEDLFETLLLLMNGFDIKIKINSFSSTSELEYTHKINVTINDVETYYRVAYFSDGIASYQELNNNNKPIHGRSFNN